jgi:hypothetical protein
MGRIALVLATRNVATQAGANGADIVHIVRRR